MEPKIVTLEGTAEEIRALLPDVPGQRLRVTAEVLERESQEPMLRKPTIEEKLQAIFREIPPEERGKLPTDISENLDHYLYGWPKK